jgi:DNA-binding IclR family transcriptional regulator
MLNQIELKTEALPYLRELTQNVGRVCHMGILSQGEVVYIEKIEPMTSIRMFSGIGKRVPVHSTSLGKALLMDKSEGEILDILKEKGMPKFTDNTITRDQEFLKEMKKTKARGYAIDNGENEPGIYCVAAPIRDYRNKVVAAISTTGRDGSFVHEPESGMIKAVKQTAAEISKKMGYSEE